MSFLFALFAIGTLGFWLLIVTASIIITALVENGRSASPTVVALITMGMLEYFSNIPIFFWALHNPLLLLGMLAAYMLAGAVFSLGKWALLVRELSAQMKKFGKWYDEGEYSHKETPTANLFKSRITNWIMYWPFSGLWTLINDPVRKMANFIYHEFVGIYDNIAAKMFSDAKVSCEEDQRKEG